MDFELYLTLVVGNQPMNSIHAVTLDLKGCQYRGSLYPGPTALVLTSKLQPFTKSTDDTTAQQPQLKVDGIVDEFCRLVQESDHMATLAGTVKGDMMDYQYQYQDEDVNRRTTTQEESGLAASTNQPGDKGKTTKAKRTTKKGKR